MSNRIIEDYLNNKYDIFYNVVRSKPFFKLKSCKSCRHDEIDDFALNSILRDLKNNGHRIQRTGLRDLLQSDFIEKANPIEEYFEKLPPWDGKTDYIKKLSDTVKTDDLTFFEWVFKKWIVALTACAVDPKITNQTIIIFIGEQGVGKSRWMEAILPDTLFLYLSSDRLNIKDKDTKIQLSENILIIMEEIGALRNSEVESVKELITKSKIKLRRAYGTYSETYIRRASFIGATNNNQILSDVTGNRRFLVVNVEDIRLPDFIDLDKVYSQAYSLYKNGFEYWFTKADVEIINKNNERFRIIFLEEELLMKHFKIPNKNNKKVLDLTASEVIDRIVSKDKSKQFSNLNPVSMGKVLTSKGFKSKKLGGIKKYQLLEK